MMDELESKLERYLEKARPAFDDVRVLKDEGKVVCDTALRYYSDARHFFACGETVNAFAALEYAEGWLDAGIAVGVIECPSKVSEQA